MADRPRVSVIMIFHEAARFMKAAVDSVLAQSFLDWELIMVDDGSTDEGTAIARRYAAEDSGRVRYVHHAGHRNLGTGPSRNAGIRASSGKYVAFVDADDILLPRAIEEGVGILDRHPAVAIACGRTLWWFSWTGETEDAARDWMSSMPGAANSVGQPPSVLTSILRDSRSCPCMGSVLIRREVLDTVGGLDDTFTGLSEDWVLWAKVLVHYPAFISDRVWLHYRQHPDSLCARAAASDDAVRAAHEKFLKWLESHLEQREVRDALLWRELRRERYSVLPPMSRLEAREVRLAPADPRLVGRALDRPRPGELADGPTLPLVGWVLGRESRAVAVELLEGERVIRRLPLDHPRPDLAKAFPDVPDAAQGGFLSRLETVGMGEVELSLRAVLADQQRVPLASLRLGRRWREETYHAAAPLVSVVITCYDQARYLDDAIESVLAQTYPHLELVVVDDGSHDNTSEVAGRYPGVRLVRQDNAGLSAARNAGIRHTNGAYLLFLDADDRLLPNAVADGLAAFAEHPEAAFVAGRYRFIDAEGVPMETSTAVDFGEDAYGALLEDNVIAMHGAVMYQRLAFQGLGGFDPALPACEDYDLYLRVARQAPVCAHAGLVSEYRRHGNAMTDRPGLVKQAQQLVLLRQQTQLTAADEHRRPRLRTGLLRLREDLRLVKRRVTASTPLRIHELPRSETTGRRRLASGGRVLLYHRIAAPRRDPWELAVSPQHFSEQLEVLRREWHPMTVAQAIEAVRSGGLPDRAVVVTFDDGYHDNLASGLPHLERHDVPAALFCATGYVGESRGFWWDDLERLVFGRQQLPSPLEVSVGGSQFQYEVPATEDQIDAGTDFWRAWAPRNAAEELYLRLWMWLQPLLHAERSDALDQLAAALGATRAAGDDRPLTLDELSTVDTHPLVSLGAHTVTHARLSTMPPSMQRMEIREGARFLEGVLARPIQAFAYPFGRADDVSNDSVRLVMEQGYEGAFMAVTGVGASSRDPFRIARHAVPDLDGDEFARWLEPSIPGLAVAPSARSLATSSLP